VRAIAIGNGTGSRESEAFGGFPEAGALDSVFGTVVNESGASVYSASDLAAAGVSDLDLTVRGAISIAPALLQDPLAELVKIDPKSIGVGQYQHDVDQKRCQQSPGCDGGELCEPRGMD